MSGSSGAAGTVQEFRDPYYYLMIALGWVGVVGALVGLWALSPWFPWK